MNKLYKLTGWASGKKYSILASSDTKFYTTSGKIKNIWELDRYETFLMSFAGIAIEDICEIELKFN